MAEAEIYDLNPFNEVTTQNYTDADLQLDKVMETEDDFLEDVSEHIQENLEDDLVKEALENGVDLRLYAKKIENDLKVVEDASINDYIKQSDKIARLHKQIGTCDNVLESMESMLFGFQHALSSISSEIQSLQEQSVEMNVKLKNRQAVKSELSQLVDEMVVPETMISIILDAPVTDRAFLEQLHELNHKIKFINQHSFNDTLACQDVKDVVQKLKFKAITKIREFLLQKIYSFRKPLSNYEVPQTAMLKSRFFYEFLLSNERFIAKEIRDEYVDTMSKVYFSYFKGYISRIMKLQFEEVADKDDLMAAEDNQKRGFFSTKSTFKNRSTIFSLGSRGKVLKDDLEASVIVPHAAQNQDLKYSFESLFRSQNYALLDNSCREYLFLCDFFLVSGNSAQDLFNSVLGKTLALFLKHISSYCSECYDAIALFLCKHIVHKYEVIMQEREVTSLKSYWETVHAIIWPRFVHIIKMNIQSVKNCDVNNLARIDVRPNYITRRYAEFSAAIVSINQGYPQKEVSSILLELQSEVQNFILRMASVFTQRRDQLIFLINNYDMMLSVIMERTVEESKESDCFQTLLNAGTQEYVEEVLTPHFGGVMTFVKDCEQIIETGNTDQLKHFVPKVLPLVREFAKNWKTSIDVINNEVMKSFTNFKIGTSILQGALTQLVQYYHRFQKLLGQSPFQSVQTRSELVNIHHVMVEVKKHKPNF